MGHSGSVLCLQFDSSILVTGSSDTTVIIWSIIDDYTPVRQLRHHSGGVLDVCFDTNVIVSCSKDSTICVCERSTGKIVHVLSGHRGPVNAVQLRSGGMLVSASGDGMAKLWNVASGLCIKDFASRDRGLACVEFSHDARTIYAGGNDHVIYVWDVKSGELIREIRGYVRLQLRGAMPLTVQSHSNLVRSLHLDDSKGLIISGSYDYSTKVFETTTGKAICDFAGWTTSWILSAKSDWRRIVETSQDRRVVVIDFGLCLPGIELLEE